MNIYRFERNINYFWFDRHFKNFLCAIKKLLVILQNEQILAGVPVVLSMP